MNALVAKPNSVITWRFGVFDMLPPHQLYDGVKRLSLDRICSKRTVFRTSFQHNGGKVVVSFRAS